MKNYIRQALVVARRDFLAIVATPTFLLFLLAPLMMFAFGMIGGMGAAAVADTSESNHRLVVIADPGFFPRIQATDKTLRQYLPDAAAPPPITYVAPQSEPGQQAVRMMADDKFQTYAILYESAGAPVIVQREEKSRSGAYLVQLASEIQNVKKASSPTIRVAKQHAHSGLSRKLLASLSVILLFMLTLILASQAVGMLAEEKGNKVIEILAAAAPLEAVFFGKLLGMLGVAILFIAFWGTLGGGLLAMGLAHAQMIDATVLQIVPAVGWPTFAALFLIYFILAFLLLGAIFLGIGAQAATMREIQMLSLPLTIVQFAMFGLSSAAAGAPRATIARIAEIIPFSSPLAMTAHAVHQGALWPHALAIVWQLAWLALTIWFAVRLFRAGVLKSGNGLFGRSKRSSMPGE